MYYHNATLLKFRNEESRHIVWDITGAYIIITFAFIKIQIQKYKVSYTRIKLLTKIE